MRMVDIAAHIHQQTGLSMTEATTLLEWILEFIRTTLQNGESIMISGFGKFTVRSKRTPGTESSNGGTYSNITPARGDLSAHSENMPQHNWLALESVWKTAFA